MRTTRELLELMLENQQFFKNGMCGWILFLYIKKVISNSEYEVLKKYIDSNKPTFFESPFYSFGNNRYYWKKGNIKPRLKWIKKHIEINS